jgi:hypothetical protein
MTDEQTQDLFRMLIGIERRLVNIEKAVLPATVAGGKPGTVALPSVYVLSLSRDWPNDYGWYKARIGTDRASDWYSTKSDSVAAFVARAKESGLIVDVTFNQTEDGQYTNRYLCTIAEKGCGPAAVERSSEEPTQKPRNTHKSSQKPAPARRAAAAGDGEEEPF